MATPAKRRAPAKESRRAPFHLATGYDEHYLRVLGDRRISYKHQRPVLIALTTDRKALHILVPTDEPYNIDGYALEGGTTYLIPPLRDTPPTHPIYGWMLRKAARLPEHLHRRIVIADAALRDAFYIFLSTREV